ncbi:DUF7286 family protein [Halomarina ordinaria]|uniref:Uncharacterized protein n=1 Tax=Halomarina ordinaria TaxID=3033939 RepID=A0ABD5U8H6_9EURY|nr:hypothetical protein [Halomarina sp. PSRA2]
MRLADDRRGRVPFALVAVLLLVGSATLVATDRSAPAREPAVDRAVEATAAATRPALETAVSDAARAAAADPVVVPGDTPYGRVLDPDEPFRDALRARVYLAARADLERLDESRGGVRARASLPPVRSPADLREAIARVSVERAGPNGTALRVRIEGVRLRAVREGRTVADREVSPTVTVASPVLALHDRATAYERSLNAGPLAGDGLGRRLTVGLHGVAWARGYAQYGGAPVANVVANRHVEVTTNVAALGLQCDVLGATTPGGERAAAWASARTATTDLLGAGGLDGRWSERVLDAAEREALDGRTVATAEGGNRDSNRVVAANRTADRALVSLLDDDGVALAEAAARNYAVDARPFVATRSRGTERTGRERPPGGNWTRVARDTTTERRVVRAPVAPVAVPDGWRTFERHGREVVRETTVTTRWRRDEETTTTRRVETRRTAVSLALAGRHAPDSDLPRRGVDGVYDRGGALDGPNLAGVPKTAHERLVTDRGGVDALAERAASEGVETEPVRIAGERPAALDGWLRRDLAGLHDRVREASVTVPRTEVATYEVDPAARLADRLRERRADLVDAPDRYDGVADRTRVAVRRAYLDRVVARLDARSSERERTRDGLDGALDDRGVGSLDRLHDLLALGVDRSAVGASESPSTGGVGGPLALSVETAPTYLTVDAVDRERLAVAGDGEVTPLGARNTNLFTVPYGDAADTVTDGLFGSERVSLRTAAGAMRAERRATGGTVSPALDREVRAANAHVRGRLVDGVARTGLGRSGTRPVTVVDRALAAWRTPDARALALANGSATDAVVSTAVAAGLPPSERAELRARLRVATADALAAPDARPPEAVVDDSMATARRVVEAGVEEAAERGADRATDRLNGTLGAVPAGLPVAPVPGYWYATLNVWDVEVQGTYERVTLRSRRGSEATVYTRDGGSVALDVDSDGAPERLGRAAPVDFETRTAVVVVVPAGPRGVGDVDGNADERSPGYD